MTDQDPRIEPLEAELRKYISATVGVGGTVHIDLRIPHMLAVADRHDPIRAELPDKIAEWLVSPEHAECFEDHELVDFVRSLLNGGLGVVGD